MEKCIVVVISNCVSYCVCMLGLVNSRVNKRSLYPRGLSVSFPGVVAALQEYSS